MFAVWFLDPEDPLVIAVLLAFTSFSEAFVNAVSQAMMVLQARRDPTYGQQDFATKMVIFTAAGGAVGCVYAGIMSELYHPKWCLFYYSFFGLILMVFALFLTEDSETDITLQYI